MEEELSEKGGIDSLLSLLDQLNWLVNVRTTIR